MITQKKDKPFLVGVLMGGFSSERPVSIRSGTAILESLKRSGYQAIAIDPRERAFNKNLSRIDVAFIALHGEYGEDGQIQTLLEKRGIPYAGSDAKGMRASFDKLITKRILRKKGLPTPDFRILTKKNWKSESAKFKGPFFIKPPTEGSSVGVELIEDFAKNADIISKSIAKYGKLLAEEKVVGREVTAGIVGSKNLPVVEIKTKRSFYDYTAKYTPGFTEYITEHGLPSKWVMCIQRVAKNVFKALGLRDFARIDMMLNHQGKPFVLEANSIPGFTALSLLPKAAAKAGISFDELVEMILGLAIKRIKNRK